MTLAIQLFYIIKVRSTVLYHNPNHNSWNKALIIRRAGKAKDELISIDFSKIKGWKNIEEEVSIAIPSDNNVRILEAKQAE